MQSDSSSVISSHNELMGSDDHSSLRSAIDHAVHYLPSQGPITVFVHHNTLHAFEHLSFEQAVKVGGEMYGCEPYLPEDRYRTELARGRILIDDLRELMMHDLGESADELIASFGTRYTLRLAMLQMTLHTAPDAELDWLLAETDLLKRFSSEVPQRRREQTIQQTRKWVMRSRGSDSKTDVTSILPPFVDALLGEFRAGNIESWSDAKWESFVLHLLWRVCHQGVETADSPSPPRTASIRLRDLLLEVTGKDTDTNVNEVLIRFCAAFLDQGFADLSLPERERGFAKAFASLCSQPMTVQPEWMRSMRDELFSIANGEFNPLDSIVASLDALGVATADKPKYVCQTLLAMRGWAGMIWQMETNAPWLPTPAPIGTLNEYLAIRLMLERHAIAAVGKRRYGTTNLAEIRRRATAESPAPKGPSIEQRTYTVFQLAEVGGWTPDQLVAMSQPQWACLVREIESFSAIERRRIFHLAYERKYRNSALDAISIHSQRRKQLQPKTDRPPAYQAIFCIDEREESMRRHLEEVDPACATLGIAGFFGVAMYYRGAENAHFKPLCPVNIKPRHYIIEEPLYSFVQAERRRAEARKRLGAVTHQTHRGTRTILGGMLTGLFGSLAAFPLVARILFPRTTAQIRRLFGEIIRTPSTELRLERIADEPGSKIGQIGYSVDEMAAIVEGGLRSLGLAKTELLSRLVVICGHGSASLNNPHEAAHDCGACGGGRGGPNARAFTQMANDLRVRRILARRQIAIPDDTFFVGGYHNTCDDSMTWYDLDNVPLMHRPLFERAKAGIDEARRRSAHERCRRFESAELSISTKDALRHVEGRAEDLSQTRPEYGHATNAMCFVGRRAWSRGLFLDRRTFLTSYDPTQDDDRSSILEQLLQAVIPVCAGINLEYYFSYVDRTGYGCGTKLPHNITSLLGVMDGPASDLRPGLPWQMVEIHEPVRILFVIETTPDRMLGIIEANPAIAALVKGNWVQLSVVDAETSTIHRFVNGGFELYTPLSGELPEVGSSVDWYRGQRDHLGFASIAESAAPSAGGDQ